MRCRWRTSTRDKHSLITGARRVRYYHVKGVLFTTKSIYSEVPGLVKERSNNVSLFSLNIDMLIIFEKLISINEWNFRFTNIETVRTITLAMKLSMEIPLFQWNQVSKHLEWKLMIDAWFGRFKSSINLIFFYYVNLVSLLNY